MIQGELVWHRPWLSSFPTATPPDADNSALRENADSSPPSEAMAELRRLLTEGDRILSSVDTVAMKRWLAAVCINTKKRVVEIKGAEAVRVDI